MAQPATQSDQTPGIWSRIRTVILVSFLTILVWVLAEARMIQTRVVELQIVLVGTTAASEQHFVVRPASDEFGNLSIDLELEGSLASLDQASRELRGRIQLEVGDQIPARAGIHDIDLPAVLRDLPPLRSHGVSIHSISTELVKVEVDEIVTIELPIRVELPSSVALTGPPRSVPPTVSVQGPATQLAIFEGRDAIAIPDPSTVSALPAGRLETVPGVALSLPINSDENLSPTWTPVLTPPRADIRLTIRSLTQTSTIDRLPIQVLIAPGEVGRWDIALEPGSEDLVSIQITGPTDALEAINSGSIVPSAALSLSFQELERAISSKQVQLMGLPDGVQVTTTLPEINFTITAAPQPIDNPVQTTP
ncbi:MAG: hypothetical protein JJ974_06440 [Phycisphaerales bacterium]|nr:hypothetical protein [Phycisphaerales bacterium]